MGEYTPHVPQSIKIIYKRILDKSSGHGKTTVSINSLALLSWDGIPDKILWYHSDHR